MARRSSGAAAKFCKSPVMFHHIIPLGVGILLFWATLWIFDPRPPVMIGRGVVLNQPVAPGSVVEVEWDQYWRRRCYAESARTIIRADHKIDNYEKAIIQPPETTGQMVAPGTAVLQPTAPPGEAIYRATVTFPRQFSLNCVLPWPISFTTQDVRFMVAKTAK